MFADDADVQADKENKQEPKMDCIFLVGGKTKEQVYASSAVLKASSDQFALLMKNSKVSDQPLQTFTHRKTMPHIFKKVIEFTHNGTLSLSGKADEVVELARAAQLFSLPQLVQRMVSVDTVWLVLNVVSQNPEMAAMCAEVLMSKPHECLRHSTFKMVYFKSLRFFFKLQPLTVQSDVLISALKKRLDNNKNRCQVALKKQLHSILSTLRCHFAKPTPISDLAKYLGALEPFPNALSFDILGDQRLKDILSNANFVRVGFAPESTTLSFVVGANLHLLGLELLSRKDMSNKEMSFREYKENLTVQVDTCSRLGHHQTLFKENIKGKKIFDSTYCVPFEKDVFIPSDDLCKIHVLLKPKVYLHQVLDIDVTSARFVSEEGVEVIHSTSVWAHKLIGNSWTSAGREAGALVTKVFFRLS